MVKIKPQTERNNFAEEQAVELPVVFGEKVGLRKVTDQ